jgi:SNF2 family DNA or RNA helicase
MNFLDPNEWGDLEALEKEHEELNEELIKSLHARLRPYFLRRLKSEVLQLPPKVRVYLYMMVNNLDACQNEVIVPVSMAPLQRQVYRSILSKTFLPFTCLCCSTNESWYLGHNIDLLKGLTQPSRGGPSKGKLNNILMHLRKCVNLSVASWNY